MAAFVSPISASSQRTSLKFSRPLPARSCSSALELHLERVLGVWILSQDDVREVQRVKGAVRVEVRSGGSQESRGTAGQIGELVPNGRRRNVVELRGRLVAKPADMSSQTARTIHGTLP